MDRLEILRRLAVAAETLYQCARYASSDLPSDVLLTDLLRATKGLCIVVERAAVQSERVAKQGYVQ